MPDGAEYFSMTDIATLKQDIDGGKIKWIKPAVDDQGQAVLGAYNENGQLVSKYLGCDVGAAWLMPAGSLRGEALYTGKGEVGNVTSRR